MASPGPARLTRIRSDYVGGGSYAVLPDDSALAVNTTYGVQAVAIDGKVKWQVDLGERCLGLSRSTDGVLLANTLHSIHQIDSQGSLVNSTGTRHELVHAPIPWRDGMLVATLTRIYAMDENGKARWKHRYRETLGKSVRAVLTVGVHVLENNIVVGAVDYDSGVGRIMVFDDEGHLTWQSDLGPITSLFPVGSNEFVYTLTGYGRFESCCTTTDGDVKWRLPIGGPGIKLNDDTLAILVGANESPTWDNWELRTFTTDGDELSSRIMKGHCCYPPVAGSDGDLYFTGFFKPLDPAESRVEYTSYVPQPIFQAFDYLMRVKAESHQYEVSYFRAPADGGDLELIFQDHDSVAFGPTVAGDNHVFFAHNKDLLALAT